MRNARQEGADAPPEAPCPQEEGGGEEVVAEPLAEELLMLLGETYVKVRLLEREVERLQRELEEKDA